MKSALAIVALVLLLRLPFLNQAVGGDDVYYLAAATHAQIDPAHPNHVHYIFEGRDVDFRGYPHPPLNAWYLALLIAIFGKVREIPFHAAYLAFSLLAAFSMWSLARRFSSQPLWATLLFLATPAFVINGNTFESDVPFVAFWLAGIAAFTAARYAGAAVLLSLAALAAPQVVLATPILAAYTWLFARSGKRAWIVALTPVLATTAWQAFEYFSDGRFPAAVAAGYLQSYGYQKLALKLQNAAGLAIHALFLVFPLLLFYLPRPVTRERIFLYTWAGVFFLGACALFYSGSARYLLPLAAPVAILVSANAPPRFLKIGFVSSILFWLLLAAVNYQHWGQNRAVAQSVVGKNLWVNGEWGLRHYLEERGALPVEVGQNLPPGATVVSSELAYPIHYSHAGSVPVSTAVHEIRPTLPLRLIGLASHSGYSTVQKGFLPFGFSNGPLDRIHVDTLAPRLPAHQYLSLASPDADSQIASGIYGAEGNPWRWTAKTGTLLLKTPAAPEPLHVRLYIPDAAPARSVTLALDGRLIATRTFPRPGSYLMETPPQTGSVLTIAVDRTFSPPGDHRELGLVLAGAGFEK